MVDIAFATLRPLLVISGKIPRTPPPPHPPQTSAPGPQGYSSILGAGGGSGRREEGKAVWTVAVEVREVSRIILLKTGKLSHSSAQNSPG